MVHLPSSDIILWLIISVERVDIDSIFGRDKTMIKI